MITSIQVRPTRQWRYVSAVTLKFVKGSVSVVCVFMCKCVCVCVCEESEFCLWDFLFLSSHRSGLFFKCWKLLTEIPSFLFPTVTVLEQFSLHNSALHWSRWPDCWDFRVSVSHLGWFKTLRYCSLVAEAIWQSSEEDLTWGLKESLVSCFEVLSSRDRFVFLCYALRSMFSSAKYLYVCDC